MEQKGYYRALDSLKGLFILIIAFHNTLADAPLFSNIPGTAFLILFGGTLGNSMFFILSGFLLSTGYKDRIQTHSLSFGAYLLRRLKKLYPMYLLSNLAALILEILRYGISAINIQKIVFTALMIGGPYNNPTWFLFVLFASYIVFYVICYYAKTPTQYLSCIILAVVVGYTLIGAELDILFLRSGYGVAYMNFFLGCIFAEGYPLISRKLHRWLQPLFLVMLPALLYLMLSYGVEIIAGDIKICFSFVMCPMILYLALVKGPCRAVLQFQGFVALGKISSYIFFWHLPFYYAFGDVYAALTQGDSVREPQYLVYLALLMLLCAGSAVLEGRARRTAKASV